MENINTKGLESLNENERFEVNKILTNSYEKLKRKTKTDFILKLVIKDFLKSGDKKDKRKHYSIRAGISGSTRAFEASAENWDLNKAVHGAIEALENEVEHAFHSSEQHNS